MTTDTHTTSAPAPKTSRLDLVFAIYHRVRLEKDPPLARYAVLLALARHGGKPVSGYQLGKEIGQRVAPGGTIDCAIRAGLIIEHRGKKPDTEPTRYILTEAGIAMVHDLTNPTIP